MSQTNVGGEKLRSLRRARQDAEGKRLTIDKVATRAGYDYRTVSDIERGVVKRPLRETIHRVLHTLEQCAPLSIEDKNAVLTAYGYQPILDLPNQEDIARASVVWAEQYRHMKLPGYLVTYDQRLVAWNRYAPMILGMQMDDPALEHLKGITTFDLAFNPVFLAASRITNGETYLPEMVRAIKAELQLFRYEAWYQELIDGTKARYPLFAHLWERAPTTLPVRHAAHGPLCVQHANGKTLTFQLIGTDFADDPRFRAVQYHPIDATTLSEWNSWVEQDTGQEEGVRQRC